MSGTADGGKSAAITNKERYGKDFYRELAYKSQIAWEQNGRKPRGFSAMTHEQRAEAGSKGGKVSRRTVKV